MDVQLNCYFCVELKFLIQKPFLLQNSESEIIILRDPIFFEDLAKTKRQAKTGWPHSSQNEIPCVTKIFPVLFLRKN